IFLSSGRPPGAGASTTVMPTFRGRKTLLPSPTTAATLTVKVRRRAAGGDTAAETTVRYSAQRTETRHWPRTPWSPRRPPARPHKLAFVYRWEAEKERRLEGAGRAAESVARDSAWARRPAGGWQGAPGHWPPGFGTFGSLSERAGDPTLVAWLQPSSPSGSGSSWPGPCPCRSRRRSPFSARTSTA